MHILLLGAGCLTVVLLAYIGVFLVLFLSGHLPSAAVDDENHQAQVRIKVIRLLPPGSRGSLPVLLHWWPPPELSRCEEIRARTRRFVAEWVFETGLYWADILQDAMILLAFYKEEFYGFLFLGICFMMVPPICVWAFRYALGRAQVSNLLLSIIQLEFVYQSTMSLVTAERTTDLFWQTAGEGGLEAPLQCILQIYKVLVTGQQERVPQFMLSIITSLFCTANSACWDCRSSHI
ncbi:unnamed protein product [Symbiodinium sp. KB8]|nr:unnamed protein product [Symbiodinium sp. KB8]